MYSEEHTSYLKKKKKYRIWVKLFQVFILLFLLILWQVAADQQWINTFISSSPKEVISTIIELHQSGDLYYHIWVTVYETIISFAIATFLGCLIATLLWWNPFVAKVLDPYLTVLNSLPKVALGPIIIIWCGAGIQSIIFMALLISLIITIINVYQGFIGMDHNKIRLMKSFKATQYQIFRMLILPGSVRSIISSLKINVSMSLIGVIMGEFLVSKAGIGYLIMYGSQVFNLDLVISGILILCVVATVMYYLIVFLEKRLSVYIHDQK